MRFTVAILTWLLTGTLCVFAATKNATVKTEDGLSLEFSEKGEALGIVDGDKRIPGNESGGIFIRDGGKDGAFGEVVGKILPKDGALEFSGENGGLSVSARFAARKTHIAVDGIVRNGKGGNRGVDLKLCLPVDCRGWQWGGGLVKEETIVKSVTGVKAGGQVTIYPIAPVSDVKEGRGITLAVPPSAVTYFDTGADQDGVYIILKLGLSDATQPPNETAFHLIIYKHDPAWGFRSALERYYAIFRDPYFIRHVKKIGAWGWHNPPPSQLANSNLYAFHETGGETWKIEDKGMHGYEHEGFNLATNVSDYERLGRLAEDEKLGIYSLPYTIVGQRQIYRLSEKPPDDAVAMKAFDKWSTEEPMLFQSPGPSVSFRSVNQLKEIIRNSNVYDEQQKPSIVLRDYVGNTVTFPLNPNPKLFSDSEKLTIAKYTLDDYLPMLFNGSKFIDGCYVDSLGRWAGYNNFRQEHFRYATMPLTYSGENAQPCIWNAQSHAEYLAELSRRLHAQNKIVFANGVHADRLMLGFYVDALGMEGLPDYTRGEPFYATRVAAGTKPYCALNGRDNVNSRVWNSCLYLGLIIGARSKAGQEMERKFLPSIIKINEAGWEPVTLARADEKFIGVERWGEGGAKPVYFTVFNRGQTKATTTLHIDARALGIKSSEASELISGQAVEGSLNNGELILRLTLESETAAAIEVGRK